MVCCQTYVVWDWVRKGLVYKLQTKAMIARLIETNRNETTAPGMSTYRLN